MQLELRGVAHCYGELRVLEQIDLTMRPDGLTISTCLGFAERRLLKWR